MVEVFHTAFRGSGAGSDNHPSARTRRVAPCRVARVTHTGGCLAGYRKERIVGWIKKILVVLVAAFVVFYLFTRPEAAAEAVKTFFGAFQSLGTFFTSLVE